MQSAITWRARWARLALYLRRDIWRRDAEHGLRALGLRVVRVTLLAVRGFLNDEGVFRAQALTYITVLSLVPLLAFSFSITKGFGLYDHLLRSTIVPFLDTTFGVAGRTAGEGHEIRSAIDRVLDFVSRADVSKLGAFGLLVLTYAVIKLLSTVEASFNVIWRVHRARSWVRKVSDYIAMTIVTPIFLLSAAALTTIAQDSSAVGFLRDRLHLGVFIDVLLGLTPVLAMWVAFTFAYLAMPNTRTRLTSALTGALVAALAWQATLILHLKFQIGVARYDAFYAGFAALPIFLIWVQISWTIVLFGAEVCCAHQREPSLHEAAVAGASTARDRRSVALAAVATIGERYLSGDRPLQLEELAQTLRIPLQHLQAVTDALVDGGVLLRVRREDGEGLVPARDLDAIRVTDVLAPLEPDAKERSTRGDDPEIDAILAGFAEANETSPFNKSVRELALERREAERSQPAPLARAERRPAS